MTPEIRKLLAEYRKAFGTLESGRQCARLAYSVASKLGHIALRQGESVECAKCGASGSAREILTGRVHTDVCS